MRLCISLMLLAMLACSASSTKRDTKRQQPFAMFITTELRGTIEPCGCNSDPLGDLARTAEQIAATRAAGTPVLVVDGGSLLYTEAPVSDQLKAQESLKSELIHEVYTGDLSATAIGLGPYDLGRGAGEVKPPRHAVNVSADAGIALEAPKLVEVGTAKVGVFGVVSPESLAPFQIAVTDPHAAAQQAIKQLRDQGADLVIGLAHMTRKQAIALVQAAPGIDIVVIGQNAPEPPNVVSAPHQEGSSFLVQPANRGQVVTRLDITLRGKGGALTDAIGEARAAIEIAAIDEDAKALGAKLTAWKADPSADPAFVAAKQSELDALGARRKALQTSPLVIPEHGSFFTMAQLRIRKALPCNATVQSAKQAYDKAAGEANSAAAAGKKPVAPAAGKPAYAGIQACNECHEEAVEFWKKTRHAGAWETLEVINKQLSYDCIGCHVTGWSLPGGSNLAYNDTLRDVQCEVCHGPASIHVAEQGGEDPVSVKLSPPQSLCVECHNSEHSDTFQYQAYLRDVTGPGHGEEFRTNLGDGPTGRELRSAALDKAGKRIGTGCLK